MTNLKTLMRKLSNDQLDKLIGFLDMLLANKDGEKTLKELLAYTLTISEEDAKIFTEIMTAYNSAA